MLIPFAASTETVKSVPNLSSFLGTIRLSPSFSARACETGAQIKPRPSPAMKLISAGVTLRAANTRSPSFSRWASSVMITIRPFRMAAITSSIRSAPCGFFMPHPPEPPSPSSPPPPTHYRFPRHPLPNPAPYQVFPHPSPPLPAPLPG